MSNKILIIGATGMLGKPVANELLNAGFEVTALVRDISKAKKNLPDEIKLVQGDLSDPTSLNNAMNGQSFVYLNLSVKPDEKEADFHTETDGMKNILQAAKDNGIKRIGYLASIIARDYKTSWWVFDIKRKAIEMIKNSGIDYCIFYPSNFMENLANTFIRNGKITIIGKSDIKNYWISGEDYGKQVVQSFKILKASENRDYTIQGPKALTMEEAVDIFINHYNKQALKKGRAPIGLFKFLGLFISELGYISKILDAINKCPEPFMSEQAWNELVSPSITVKDFAIKSSQ